MTIDNPTSSAPRNPQQYCEEAWKIIQDHAPHLKRVLLVGPPGIGKSVEARNRLSSIGMGECLTTTLSHDMVYQELFGFWCPKGGDVVWQDGPLSAALRNGQPCVIDEIGRASAPVLDGLLAVLEKPSRVLLPNGERLTSDVPIWATTNDTHMMEEPLIDRFDLIIHVNKPAPGLITHLNQKQPGLGHVIFDSFSDPSRAISPRKGVFFTELVDSIGEKNVAAKIAFDGRGDDVLATLALHPVLS